MQAQDDPEESSNEDDAEGFQEGDTASSPGASKKIRPTRACDFCRRKKVKCEGNPCANCINHSQDCTFVQQTKKRPVRKDHKYIAKIEEENKRLDEHTKRIEAALADAAPDVYETLKRSDKRASGGLPRQRPTKTVAFADTSSRPFPAGAFLFGDGMTFGAYVGPTSPWTFLQETRSYAAHSLSFIDTAQPATSLDFLQVQIGSAIPAQTQTASPVRRDNAAQYYAPYVNAWFTHAGGIHGCMHRPTFESSARASFAPNATPPWEFALLYHSVLAIGACFLGETDRCYQFLKTACNMMMPRVYQSQDIKIVQATYLLSLLLFILGKYGVAYGLLGHAIRLAYANGLHRDATIQRQDGIPLSAIEIEERRRIFWSIYYLDTFLSLILGRPPSISDSDLDAELPDSIQDSQLTAEGALPEAMEAQREEYLHGSLRSLCLQLRKIYDELYSATSQKGQTQSALLASITALDDDLANWRGNLPAAHMPFLSPEETQNIVHVPAERAYFSLAYYFSVCLVHRPALVQLLQATPEDIAPQRSPRHGKSPARTVNLARVTGSSGLEQPADRCVIAARDLLRLVLSGSILEPNQLSYLHCSADLMVSRLLPPCTITAGSIIVDNLIRDPQANSTVEDLQLLRAVRQTIEASVDRALSRSLINTLNELERIAVHAIQREAPSQLSRIPDTQSPVFYASEPSTSQPWTHSYATPNDLSFVAAPMGYGISFQQQTPSSSGLYQQQAPNPAMQSYAQPPPELHYQFQPAESTGPSLAQHVRQHIASPPTIIQHPQDIHSSYQPMPWGQNSSTGLGHSILQPPSQQQYSYPGQQWISNISNPPPPSPTRSTRGGHKKSPSRSSRGRGQRQ